MLDHLRIPGLLPIGYADEGASRNDTIQNQSMMPAQELSMTTLETHDLTIRFGGHVAVNRVNCIFRPGELTAIVGPNGAGKTTYFNLISGQLRPSEGRILFDGNDITGLSAPLRTRAGLGRAFQLTNLFPNLSGRGKRPSRRAGRQRRALRHAAAVDGRAAT